MSDKLLRADQVQKRLACSRTTVCKLLREGHLRGFKVGSQWRIYESSLQRYIEEAENPCAACVA
jgi:excisionase family DNA binding protein